MAKALCSQLLLLPLCSKRDAIGRQFYQGKVWPQTRASGVTCHAKRALLTHVSKGCSLLRARRTSAEPGLRPGPGLRLSF
eukprot:s1269_g11.t1